MVTEISICGAESDPRVLARFFCANVSAAYISHSEMQSERVLPDGGWAPNLEDVMADEIAGAIAQDPAARYSAASWNGVIVARDGDAIAGLMIACYGRAGGHAFGVLEDLVVDAHLRGRGIGSDLVRWVLADMKAAGLTRAFLESGIHNHRPHALFRSLGFAETSIVMARELD